MDGEDEEDEEEDERDDEAAREAKRKDGNTNDANWVGSCTREASVWKTC